MRLPGTPTRAPATGPAARSGPATAAFTLIELVLSAALMSIILGAAYACLWSGWSSRSLVESRSDILQRARVAMTLVTADLRGATPLSEEREFVGMDRTLGEVEADNLDFATHHFTPRHPGEGDICEVSYFIEADPDTGDYILFRRQDASPEEDPLSGGRRVSIARGLSALRFEYYDGYEWFDEWGDPQDRHRGRELALLPVNATGLPDAVRVTMWFATDEPSDTSGTSQEMKPSMMVQSVARLNLAPIAAYTSAGATGEESSAESPPTRDSQGGTP